MMHEHVIVDYATNFGKPSLDSNRVNLGCCSLQEQEILWEKPLTVEDAGYIRCYFNQNRDNMVLSDIPSAVRETSRFKSLGGSTIVECSLDSIGRNPSALKEVSTKTGINIVMGCGWYLDRVHPKEMNSLSVEDLTEKLVKDITEGVDGVKAGIIGELGCTTDITPNEEKVLQAGARAQKITGASISIHPGYSKESPFKILDILEKAGANLSRVIMGHVDRGILDYVDLVSLAQRGCVLEFDQFGWGCSFNHALAHHITYPSDFDRCKTIKRLIDAGFGKHIVVSHDIAFKTRYTTFGGTSTEKKKKIKEEKTKNLE
eukprot:TRINITY_DN109_c0_g5_i3.p1 TRINITY_DN109_c0_g5~~TRINITY_DN109_c0_g5_i3.p1  ORF type:complete len:317 (-),score=74.21 TRINITY_DN109_c0_g5_i3:234-1184(-)